MYVGNHNAREKNIVKVNEEEKGKFYGYISM
jgi:hypothetical protein